MRFSIRSLTQADQRAIAGWRYAAPYDVYNGSDDVCPTDCYRALTDAEGVFSGTFCWGEEARVNSAQAVYDASPGPMDFGIGLRPELAGHGAGIFASEAALTWLREAFHPTAFRLAVYAWNRRAQKVYARLGFVPLMTCGAFLLMQRDERPWRDATRPLQNGMPVYHADPGFDRHLLYHKENCGYDMSVFAMSAHSGTHVDAPAHIGLPGDVDSLPLECLNGSVQLLDWPTPDLAAIRSPRLLLKTGGRGLTPEETQALLDAGVTMLGLDAMSAGEGDTEFTVHQMLLSAGVIILENAALEDFAPGWYAMRCLPLRMPGSDGAPVRLLLREEDNA